MLKHRRIDLICVVAIITAVLLAILLMLGGKIGINRAAADPEYANMLFDDGRVHTIDIQYEEWDEFIENARSEEYVPCGITVDGEDFENVGLRVKGNNSRTLTGKYNLQRYGMKLEMDHYEEGLSYHGLDKLSLDPSFQDNSYMKTYITYEMMRFMKVPASLCSYAFVTVNGEPWGLFLAVEEPEESFAVRNYGDDYGKLYKPEYMSLDEDNRDIWLMYNGEGTERYENIFREARFDIVEEDKRRVIDALRALAMEENLQNVIDVEEVLRYFTVHTFVVNLDSYTGPTGHNYFLYEDKGKLSILPWDYNLAFATYPLGKPEPVNDAKLFINYPIDTPAEVGIIEERPLFNNLIVQGDYKKEYHRLYRELIEGYFDTGLYEAEIAKADRLIAPYVQKDPTAYCSYEDYRTAVSTLTAFGVLRSESIRRQLAGELPSQFSADYEDSDNFVEPEGVWIPDLGEIADLT